MLALLTAMRTFNESGRTMVYLYLMVIQILARTYGSMFFAMLKAISRAVLIPKITIFLLARAICADLQSDIRTMGRTQCL